MYLSKSSHGFIFLKEKYLIRKENSNLSKRQIDPKFFLGIQNIIFDNYLSCQNTELSAKSSSQTSVEKVLEIFWENQTAF